MAPPFGILPGESLGIPSSGVDPDSLLRKMLSRVFGSGLGLDLPGNNIPDATQTTVPSNTSFSTRSLSAPWLAGEVVGSNPTRSTIFLFPHSFVSVRRPWKRLG